MSMKFLKYVYRLNFLACLNIQDFKNISVPKFFSFLRMVPVSACGIKRIFFLYIHKYSMVIEILKTRSRGRAGLIDRINCQKSHVQVPLMKNLIRIIKRAVIRFHGAFFKYGSWWGVGPKNTCEFTREKGGTVHT